MHRFGKWLMARLMRGWFWQVLAGLLIGVGLVALDELIELVVLGSGHSAAHSSAGRLWLEIVLFAAIGMLAIYVLMERQRQTERLRWLTRAVEQSVNMVIITDLEGHVEYVNPKFTEVTGYTLEEALGHSPGFLETAHSSREEFIRLWDAVARDGELRGERRNRRKNGEQYWESVLVSPLLNAEGVTTHYLSIKEDITARKEAEEMERAQRAWSETLSEMVAVLNTSLDTATIVDRVLTFVGLVMPHTSGAVLLTGDDGTVQVTRLIGTLPEAVRAFLTSLHADLKDAPDLRWMYETHQPMVIPDVTRSPYWSSMNTIDWLRSYVAAPICREGYVFGFIALHSEEPGFFNSDHMERLQTFANHAAIALANARLLTSEREQRILAEELHAAAVVFNSTLDLNVVLDHVLASAERLLAHDAAFIILLEDGHYRVARQHGCEPDEIRKIESCGLLSAESPLGLGAMLDTLHPAVIADMAQAAPFVERFGQPRLHAFLAVPIIISDQMIGLLGVLGVQPGQFSESDAARVRMFADQAALALHNAQSHAIVQRQASDLGIQVRERTDEIARQRSHLAVILDSIGEGVIHVQHGKIAYTNRALRRMFGYVEGELPDQMDDLRDFDLQGGTAIDDFLRSAEVQLGSGHIWRSVLQARRKDGTPFDVALTISRAGIAEEDRALGIVIIVRDVSQEKALQEQKDRFLAHAAHELRTPISNIKTRLYLLRQRSENPVRHLDVMEDVAQTMQNLVEDMLDLVRMERHSVSLRRQVVVLNLLVQDVARRLGALAARKGVKLELDLSEQEYTTCADYARLAQALERLVSTAIYQVSDRPRVVLSLQRDQVGSMPYALIEIWYGDQWLDDEQIAHVFDPFARANEADSQGVGLGLALAQQIVRLHQGEIWLDRAPEEGMIFRVRLTLDRDCSQYIPVSSWQNHKE